MIVWSALPLWYSVINTVCWESWLGFIVVFVFRVQWEKNDSRTLSDCFFKQLFADNMIEIVLNLQEFVRDVQLEQ